MATVGNCSLADRMDRVYEKDLNLFIEYNSIY
jgi:hypothetical protein